MVSTMSATSASVSSNSRSSSPTESNSDPTTSFTANMDKENQQLGVCGAVAALKNNVMAVPTSIGEDQRGHRKLMIDTFNVVDEKKEEHPPIPSTPLEEGQEALWVEQHTYVPIEAQEGNLTEQHLMQQQVVLLLPPDSGGQFGAQALTSICSDRPSTRASATRLFEAALSCDDPKRKTELAEQALNQALQARLRQLDPESPSKSISSDTRKAQKQWKSEHADAMKALKAGKYEIARQSLERLSPEDDMSTLGFDNTFDLPSATNATTVAKTAAGKKDADLLSMSSLNEILDGPDGLVSPNTPRSPNGNEVAASETAPETTTLSGNISSSEHQAAAVNLDSTVPSKRLRLIPRLFRKKDKEKNKQIQDLEPSDNVAAAKDKSQVEVAKNCVATNAADNGIKVEAPTADELQTAGQLDEKLKEIVDVKSSEEASVSEPEDAVEEQKQNPPLNIIVQNKETALFSEKQPVFIAAPQGPAEKLMKDSWNCMQANGDVPDCFPNETKVDLTLVELDTSALDMDHQVENLPTCSPASSINTEDKYTVATVKSNPEPDKYSVLASSEDPCNFWNPCLDCLGPHSDLSKSTMTMPTILHSPVSEGRSVDGSERYLPQQEVADEVEKEIDVFDDSEQQPQSAETNDENKVISDTIVVPEAAPSLSVGASRSTSKTSKKRFRLFARRKSKTVQVASRGSFLSLGTKKKKEKAPIAAPTPRRMPRKGRSLVSKDVPAPQPVLLRRPADQDYMGNHVECHPVMIPVKDDLDVKPNVDISGTDHDASYKSSADSTTPGTSTDGSIGSESDPLVEKIKEQASRQRSGRDPGVEEEEVSVSQLRGIDP